MFGKHTESIATSTTENFENNYAVLPKPRLVKAVGAYHGITEP